MSDPFKPSVQLLIKLGSIAVHADEAVNSGHPFDAMTINSLLEDTEVKAWMKSMGDKALLPLKR